MNPAVTVVIPTRNRRRRVADAVASAQEQTLREIEILVVDDASIDGTGDVLADVASQDPRVRVLRQAEPGGAPRARNRGLDEARGEFVAFLDDDDRWLPYKLERQVSFLADHSDVVLVGCHYRTVVEGADQTLDFRGPSELTGDDLLWWNFIGSASNAVVVPGRLPQAVRFDPEFPAYQDWDFYLQCNELGPVAVIPEVLCEYVVHNEPGRITNQLANRLVGHELTLRRHGKRMSPACLAYHRARMRVLATTSKGDKLRLLPTLVRETPPVVLRALVTESVSSRVGRLRHDPALPQRRLQKVAAATRRGSHAGSLRQT